MFGNSQLFFDIGMLYDGQFSNATPPARGNQFPTPNTRYFMLDARTVSNPSWSLDIEKFWCQLIFTCHLTPVGCVTFRFFVRWQEFSNVTEPSSLGNIWWVAGFFSRDIQNGRESPEQYTADLPSAKKEQKTKQKNPIDK